MQTLQASLEQTSVTSCPKTPAAERKNKTQENWFWLDTKGERCIRISSSVTGVPQGLFPCVFWSFLCKLLRDGNSVLDMRVLLLPSDTWVWLHTDSDQLLPSEVTDGTKAHHCVLAQAFPRNPSLPKRAQKQWAENKQMNPCEGCKIKWKKDKRILTHPQLPTAKGERTGLQLLLAPGFTGSQNC